MHNGESIFVFGNVFITDCCLVSEMGISRGYDS
jgi:hypothetical protein